MTTTETLIRELADRAELADLIARHSVWIDESRWDETDRIFTDDVVARSPRGEARGIKALVDLVSPHSDDFAATVHAKSNLVIDLDGDTATVRAHDIAVFAIDDKTEAIAAGIGRYSARRTERGWRINRLEILPVAMTEALTRAL